jgi:hypothetical protein
MSSLQNAKDLIAIDGAGVEYKPAPATGLVTLAATDDFYFMLPFSEDATVQSVHILTGAAIAGTFTIESCNFAKDATAASVADHNEVSGNWVKENPTGAYVASVGTGWTWTLLTGAKTAGAGGAMIHLGNIGSKRLRLKLACTTSGTVRVSAHGKK